MALALGERIWEVLELKWIDRFHDWRHAHLWMDQHYEVPAVLCVAYVVVIFGIKHFMKDRKPFDLQFPLFWWYVHVAPSSFPVHLLKSIFGI